MVAIRPERLAPKVRPPLRKVPDDFDVIFVEQGRLGCEPWYRARRDTVTRWMHERDAIRTATNLPRLIDARAAYVAHLRANGQWLTRSSRLVEHRSTERTTVRSTIRDNRKVSDTLARHAAQYLRISRNGRYIVSPASDGAWWVGSRRMSAAQMLDVAISKGFDEASVTEETSDTGGYRERKDRVVMKAISDRAALQRDSDDGIE